MEDAAMETQGWIFNRAEDLRDWLAAQRASGATIGFVPTMGALHAGHGSLVARSVGAGHRTVVSIFVNPTQFTDQADFEGYPVTLAEDLKGLRAWGAAAVFVPTVDEVYGGETAMESVNWGPAFGGYEAADRPGHFDGVVAVLDRLFRVVAPDAVFMGEKDLQQLAVVRVLASRRFPGLQVVGCPVVREPDGLAMSSRNRRLGAEAREQARALYRVLRRMGEEVVSGEAPTTALERGRRALGEAPGVRVFYLDLVQGEDFAPWSPAASGPTFAIVAAEVGGVRLLDNILLTAPSGGQGGAGEVTK